jgi:hypothetical protein
MSFGEPGRAVSKCAPPSHQQRLPDCPAATNGECWMSCCWSDRSPARLGSHRAAVAPLGGKALAAALPTAAVGAGGSHIRRASLLGLPFEAIGG